MTYSPKSVSSYNARREPPPTAGLPLQLSDWLPASAYLESALAEFIGVGEALVSCSGTAALVAALEALMARAPERLDVIVPAYTCPLVPLAIAHCGLTTVLCDIEPETFNFDLDALERLCGANTLAVIPTHYGGRVSAVLPAVEIAHAAGAWVIEDAAQSLGAKIDGCSVGLAGDIGFFSLAVGKGLTLFEGGVLVSKTPALLAECRARLFHQYHPPHWRQRLRGYVWDWQRTFELLAYTVVYRPALLRWVYARPVRKALAHNDLIDAAGDDFSRDIPLHRVGSIRKTIGYHALKRLPQWLHQLRQQGQERYHRLLQLEGIHVYGDHLQQTMAEAIATTEASTHTEIQAEGAWPFIMILMPSNKARDWLIERSWGAGLGTSLMFVHAMPDYEAYRDIIADAAPNDFPGAREIASRMVVISNSPWMTDVRFEALCSLIRKAISVTKAS